MTNTIHSCGDFCQLPACVSARADRAIRERCDLAVACLPDAPYRAALRKLLDDLLARLDAMKACLDAETKAFRETCVISAIRGAKIDTLQEQNNALLARLKAAEKDAALWRFAVATNGAGFLNFNAAYEKWDGDGDFADVIKAAMAQGVKP